MQIQKLPELMSLTVKLRDSIQKRKKVNLFFMLAIVTLFIFCVVIKTLIPLITTLVFSYAAYFIFNFIRQRNDLLLYKELERFMDVFMSGLSAGLSVNKAMEFALDGLGGSRFKKIFNMVGKQLAINIRSHIAIRKAGEEFKIKELELLAVILESQLKTGFPPSKLLLQVRSVIVDRMRFSRKIKLFNSQNELSANVLSSIPVLLLGSVVFFKSEYLNQINQNFSAQLFLLLAVLMDIAGLWMMRRLTRYGG